MPFLAACLQMRSGRNLSANVDAVAQGVSEAKRAGALYLQTPEMTTILEKDRDTLLAQIGSESINPELDRFRTMARDAGLTLHIGSMAVRVGGKIANRSFVIDPEGKVVATYDKIHMFDVDLAGGESWRESSTYTAGTAAVIADLPFARLGLTICYDLRFPHLFHAYGEAGAEMIAVPSAFTRQTGEMHWHVLQRARAIENAVYILAAAQGGRHEDGRETYGHSLIVSPSGAVLAEAGTQPGLLYANIDLQDVALHRARIPNLKHVRSFAKSWAPTSDAGGP